MTTTALWIEFKERSLILLRRHDPAYYRARGLFHEFGHIVFGHPACTALTGATDGSLPLRAGKRY